MWLLGFKGPSGFSARSTAEQVTDGIDGSGLTAIVTGFVSIFSSGLLLFCVSWSGLVCIYVLIYYYSRLRSVFSLLTSVLTLFKWSVKY